MGVQSNHSGTDASQYVWDLYEVSEIINSDENSLFILNYKIKSLNDNLQRAYRIPYPHAVEYMGIKIHLIKDFIKDPFKIIDEPDKFRPAKWVKSKKPFEEDVARADISGKELNFRRNQYLKSKSLAHYIQFRDPLKHGQTASFTLAFYWPKHQLLSESSLSNYKIQHPEIFVDKSKVFEPKTQARIDRATKELNIGSMFPPNYLNFKDKKSRKMMSLELLHDTLTIRKSSNHYSAKDLQNNRLALRIVKPLEKIAYCIHWDVLGDNAYHNWKGSVEVKKYDAKFTHLVSVLQ